MLPPKLSAVKLRMNLSNITSSFQDKQQLNKALSGSTQQKTEALKTMGASQLEHCKRLLLKGLAGWAYDPADPENATLVQAKTGLRILGFDGRPIIRYGKLEFTERPYPYSQLAAFLRHPDIEHEVPHMYLDKNDYVTIGIGHLVRRNELSLLPLVHKRTGEPATADEILREFEHVQTLAGGNLIAAAFESETRLILPSTEIDQLFERDINQNIRAFVNGGSFRDLAKWPINIQIAVGSIVFATGASRFIRDFIKFIPACMHRDWITAQKESNLAGLERRNDKVWSLFNDPIANEIYFISTATRDIGRAKQLTKAGDLTPADFHP